MQDPTPRTMTRWYVAGAAVLLVAAGVVLLRAGLPRFAQADGDYTSLIAPAAAPKQPAAIVTTEAKLLLDKMRTAYQGLKAAEFAGAVSSNVDADGEQQQSSTNFTSSFADPDTFRHEGQGDLTAGANGDKLFVFNQAANEYLVLDAPKSGGILQMPEIIPGILQAQNPSLLFALLDDPTTQFTSGFASISRAPDVELDGKKHPALVLEPHQKDEEGNLTLILDPDTHLLRQLRVDLTPPLVQRGLKEVKVAEAVVDYTSTKTGVEFAENHFAWVPPPDAKDVTGAGQQAEQQAGAALIGKPAPDFQLTTLDGKSVSLADLKGQVVVLDFWASWCPPCIESLPHLGKLYDEKQDGVKVFAVNLREEKSKIEAFLKSRNLNVPVLLDSEGEVASEYNVISIPQTVVIGKDGTVKNVFVGLGDDGFDAIRREVKRQQEVS